MGAEDVGAGEGINVGVTGDGAFNRLSDGDSEALIEGISVCLNEGALELAEREGSGDFVSSVNTTGGREKMKGGFVGVGLDPSGTGDGVGRVGPAAGGIEGGLEAKFCPIA